MVGAAGRAEITGHTCAELAAAMGVAVGAPEGLYHDGSGVAPDEVLHLESAATLRLAYAFAEGEAALRLFAPGETPVLWPEHFDVGLTQDEVNYGVSLGDGYLDEPYAYVGPYRPRTGEFWNAPFGAAQPLRELTAVGAVVAFFTEGAKHAAQP